MNADKMNFKIFVYTIAFLAALAVIQVDAEDPLYCCKTAYGCHCYSYPCAGESCIAQKDVKVTRASIQ